MKFDGVERPVQHKSRAVGVDSYEADTIEACEAERGKERIEAGGALAFGLA